MNVRSRLCVVCLIIFCNSISRTSLLVRLLMPTGLAPSQSRLAGGVHRSGCKKWMEEDSDVQLACEYRRKGIPNGCTIERNSDSNRP